MDKDGNRPKSNVIPTITVGRDFRAHWNRRRCETRTETDCRSVSIEEQHVKQITTVGGGVVTYLSDHNLVDAIDFIVLRKRLHRQLIVQRDGILRFI